MAGHVEHDAQDGEGPARRGRRQPDRLHVGGQGALACQHAALGPAHDVVGADERADVDALDPLRRERGDERPRSRRRSRRRARAVRSPRPGRRDAGPRRPRRRSRPPRRRRRARAQRAAPPPGTARRRSRCAAPAHPAARAARRRARRASGSAPGAGSWPHSSSGPHFEVPASGNNPSRPAGFPTSGPRDVRAERGLRDETRVRQSLRHRPRRPGGGTRRGSSSPAPRSPRRAARTRCTSGRPVRSARRRRPRRSPSPWSSSRCSCARPWWSRSCSAAPTAARRSPRSRRSDARDEQTRSARPPSAGEASAGATGARSSRYHRQSRHAVAVLARPRGRERKHERKGTRR